METLDEILAALNSLFQADGGEKAVLDALANSSVPVVKKFRGQAFANGKREGASDKAGLSDKLAAAEEKVVELTEKVTELTDKAPDVAKIEEKLKAAHAKEIAKLNEKIAARIQSTRTIGTDRAKRVFLNQLTDGDDDAAKVDKEYAREVLAAKYQDHLVVDPETGEITDVLQVDKSAGYAADSIDEKLKLLANDVRKTVPPKWIAAESDAGGGVGNRGTSNGTAGASSREASKAAAAPVYRNLF